MSTPHRATPEQWKFTERQATQRNHTAQLLLELRDRIAALEAQRETEKACILDIYEKLDRLKTQHEANWARIVKLEEAANHPAKPDSSPAPAGGLVERVIDVLNEQTIYDSIEHTASAAILAVAEWFDAIGYGATASILRREV